MALQAGRNTTNLSMVRLCGLAGEITRARPMAGAECGFFSTPLSSADEDGEDTVGTGTARGVHGDLLSDPAAQKRTSHGRVD